MSLTLTCLKELGARLSCGERRATEGDVEASMSCDYSARGDIGNEE